MSLACRPMEVDLIEHYCGGYCGFLQQYEPNSKEHCSLCTHDNAFAELVLMLKPPGPL